MILVPNGNWCVACAKGRRERPVYWSGLDVGGQRTAGRAVRIGGSGFNADLSSFVFLDGSDDEVVGEVQKGRRRVDWPGVLEQGS